MFNHPRRTLADTARIEGVGLHSGAPCTVVLHPSRAGGLRIRHGQQTVPVHIDHATSPGGSTRLGPVDTPEHLLAALVGLGITDLDIHVEGPEVPGLDGSAAPWVEACGTPVSFGSIAPLVLDRPLEVRQGEGVARAFPSPAFTVAVDVDFGPACRGDFAFTVSPAAFTEQVAWARTFLPHAHLARVEAAGRGRGAAPGSVVILGPRGPLVPVRSPDEPVRHKALDLLGDLALLGRPVQAGFAVERGTHALHQALVRAVLSASP